MADIEPFVRPQAALTTHQDPAITSQGHLLTLALEGLNGQDWSQLQSHLLQPGVSCMLELTPVTSSEEGWEGVNGLAWGIY